ncbi:MAG TPA: CocE/NonD family hydrolase [Thermoleophilaceae bacterium]
MIATFLPWRDSVRLIQESRRKALVLAALLIAAVLASAPPASAQSDPLSALRTSCAAKKSPDGARYRICTAQVASFDGTPLDVTLTLPAKRSKRRVPLVAFLHGFLSQKGEYLSETREGTGPDRGADAYKTVRWNNVWFASRGYAVLNYTARGHGDSGGQIGLASRDVEVRDTQYLTGLLVDRAGPLARIDRRRVGVIGGSYGGGQTWLLMTTRPSASLPYGTWLSPAGRRVELAAVVPMYTWSDLLYALVPNGRHLSSGVDPRTAASPIGIAKLTLLDGFLATAGPRLPQQVYGWLARVNAGEPYEGGDPLLEEARRELTVTRSGFYQDGYFEALRRRKVRRVPVLAAQGWTDPLFPAIEVLRMYRRLKASSPGYPIQLYLGDFEHLTARSKVADLRHFHVLGNRLLDRHLRGRGPKPVLDARAAVTNCDEKRFGPVLKAKTWDGLAGPALSFDLGGPKQTTARAAGQGPATDPIVLAQQRGRGCITTTAADSPGSARYSIPLTAPATLLGLPRVTVTYTATAPDFELNAHLWDVAPDGTRTLIDRGAYRGGPVLSGTADYELFGNAWRVEAGHQLELELLQDDSTFLRPHNYPSTVTVQNARLGLHLAAPG